MSIFNPDETAAEHASRKNAAIGSSTSANADRGPVALTPGQGMVDQIEIPPVQPIGLEEEKVRPIGL